MRVQIAQNRLISDLKAAGIWNKLDTFAVFATDGNSDFALIDWKRLSQLTAVNSPTFTTNQGFTGNGLSSYINTNFNPFVNQNNITLNNSSFGAYFNANLIQDKGIGTIGYYFNPTTQTVSGVSLIRSIFTGPGVNAGSHTGRVGLFQVDRRNSTNVEHIKNGISLANPTSNSNSIPNNNLFLLAYNNISPLELSTDQISMYFAGSSLFNEKTDFYNAWINYFNVL